jgi:hypothetical protein
MNAAVAREPRYAVTLSAAVTVGDEGAQRAARVTNLSRGGLCIEGPVGAPVDGFVGVEIRPDDDRGRIILFGVVRWATEGRVGLEIGGMHPRHRHRHEALLDSLAA